MRHISKRGIYEATFWTGVLLLFLSFLYQPGFTYLVLGGLALLIVSIVSEGLSLGTPLTTKGIIFHRVFFVITLLGLFLPTLYATWREDYLPFGISPVWWGLAFLLLYALLLLLLFNRFMRPAKKGVKKTTAVNQTPLLPSQRRWRLLSWWKRPKQGKKARPAAPSRPPKSHFLLWFGLLLLLGPLAVLPLYALDKFDLRQWPLAVLTGIWLGLVLLTFVVKTKQALQARRLQALRHQQEILTFVNQAENKGGRYKTALDLLYDLVNEKGKVCLSEVAKAFRITPAQAEEWGKILAEHDLVRIHYPPIGETELWKTSKSTPSSPKA